LYRGRAGAGTRGRPEGHGVEREKREEKKQNKILVLVFFFFFVADVESGM
jgi:hypothetical protein